MKKITQLIIWTKKAWPFITIMIIACIHYKILQSVEYLSAETINEFVSSFTQIIGWLIVLYNINANLGLFKQKNLLFEFLKWLKSFPIFRKIEPISASVNVNSPRHKISGEAFTGKPCNSLEEKIEEAQR